MAELTSQQRAEATVLLIRKMFVEANQTAQLDSVEVRQLIDDVDTWAEANQTAFNNAIRVALRTKATTAQKAFTLAYVAMKRAGVI
jgi:hypothetical protein